MLCYYVRGARVRVVRTGGEKKKCFIVRVTHRRRPRDSSSRRSDGVLYFTRFSYTTGPEQPVFTPARAAQTLSVRRVYSNHRTADVRWCSGPQANNIYREPVCDRRCRRRCRTVAVSFRFRIVLPRVLDVRRDLAEPRRDELCSARGPGGPRWPSLVIAIGRRGVSK